MPVINVSNYDGTIHNLAVNGTLNLTGRMTSTGFMGHSTTFYTNAGQSAISETLITNIAVQTDGIGADLVASNSNSRFTYTGATTRSWIITYSVGCPDLDIASATVFAIWIKKGAVRYGQNLISTSGKREYILSCSTIITMAQNEFIELFAYQNTANAFTISSGSYPTTLTIME